MSKKNGFSMLEAITPIVRLLPPAKLRAWRLGWYFNSAMAFITRARVELLTTLALFRTRETVAVENLARRATLSRLILFPPFFVVSPKSQTAIAPFQGPSLGLPPLWDFCPDTAFFTDTPNSNT